MSELAPKIVFKIQHCALKRVPALIIRRNYLIVKTYCFVLDRHLKRASGWVYMCVLVSFYRAAVKMA